VKACLLAAGRGERLGEISEHTPKPMVKVGGRAVIEHDLRWLAAHGVREVAINLHHLGDVIERHVGDGSAFGVSVRYSRESELLGTAGALKPLEDFLKDGPFLVVYGDNLFDFDLRKLVAAHADNAAVATLALFSPDQHAHTGVAGGWVEMDRSDRILRFTEGHVDTGLHLVNAGCYVVEPSLLQHVPEGTHCDFGRDLFPKVLRSQGILCGHMIDGWCLGLDTPKALAEARRFFVERLTGAADGASTGAAEEQ
jgi:NDP-sugar pyrophosphorylase family protein